MAIDPAFTSAIDKARGDISTAQSGLATANQEAANLVAELKKGGFKHFGKDLSFNTLDEWLDTLRRGNVLKNGRLYDANPTYPKILNALNNIKNASQNVKAAEETLAPLTAMKELLDKGDIMGAVMMLQVNRAKSLEDQLANSIAAQQAKVAAVRALTTRLADAQKSAAADKENGDKQKAVTLLKGQIDEMNNTSQLDMIGIQTLVNKRNEAFDTLTNLLNKFQKTIDNIVSNMR